MIRELTGFRKGKAIIGRKRYGRIAAGSSARIRVPIRAAAVHAVDRDGHMKVRAAARELDTDGMPKRTFKTMRLSH